MKKLILIALIAFSCAISKYRPPEYFVYKGSDIYHVSSEQDTTLLSPGDLKILRIDSLNKYHGKNWGQRKVNWIWR